MIKKQKNPNPSSDILLQECPKLRGQTFIYHPMDMPLQAKEMKNVNVWRSIYLAWLGRLLLMNVYVYSCRLTLERVRENMRLCEEKMKDPWEILKFFTPSPSEPFVNGDANLITNNWKKIIL